MSHPTPLARALRTTVLALCCSLAAGCYSLRPLRADAPLRDQQVRVFLTDGGAQSVAAPLGAARDVLDGRVVRADSGSLVVRVRSAGAVGFGEQVLFQELRLQRTEVEGIHLRRLDPVRTGLLVGGVAAASGFLLYQALTGETGASATPGGGGGVEARIPLLRLQLP